MEPMTLGSSPSSPSSPNLNPGYLPAFLIADNNPSSNNPNVSPGRKPMLTSTPDSRLFYSRLYNQMDSPKQTFTPHKAGPPSQGLFDTLEQKRKPPSPGPIMQSTVIESPRSFALENSVCSRNFNDTLNVSHLDKIDTHWVTVFGFPPTALSLVLAQMNSCGVIVDKKVPTQGNWVHVKFNSLSEVPKALALNGKCLNTCIMIGVMLYYNKEDKENETVYVTPIRARSLRHSYVSPGNSSVLAPQNVPHKSTGLVSKAIEYVFGW